MFFRSEKYNQYNRLIIVSCVLLISMAYSYSVINGLLNDVNNEFTFKAYLNQVNTFKLNGTTLIYSPEKVDKIRVSLIEQVPFIISLICLIDICFTLFHLQKQKGYLQV